MQDTYSSAELTDDVKYILSYDSLTCQVLCLLVYCFCVNVLFCYGSWKLKERNQVHDSQV